MTTKIIPDRYSLIEIGYLEFLEERLKKGDLFITTGTRLTLAAILSRVIQDLKGGKTKKNGGCHGSSNSLPN